jgi:hypothetical protein
MKGCCCGLLTPRVVIVLLVIFTDWIGTAIDSTLAAFLGFVFLPLTTLAYAFIFHQHGEVEGIWIALLVVAVLVDLGLIGGSAKESRKKRDD